MLIACIGCVRDSATGKCYVLVSLALGWVGRMVWPWGTS